MIRMADTSELAYGGLVTLTEWWDSKRIADGKIAKKDLLKKAGFYTYLVVGLVALSNSIWGWYRKGEVVCEHVSQGFIYDLPRFVFNTVQNMKTTTTGGGGADAVAQANAILAQRRAQEAAAIRQNAGKGTGDEVYVENGLRGRT